MNEQIRAEYQSKQLLIKFHLILSVIAINIVIAGRSPLSAGPASVATEVTNITLLLGPATQVGARETYHIHIMRAYSPKWTCTFQLCTTL